MPLKSSFRDVLEPMTHDSDLPTRTRHAYAKAPRSFHRGSPWRILTSYTAWDGGPDRALPTAETGLTACSCTDGRDLDFPSLYRLKPAQSTAQDPSDHSNNYYRGGPGCFARLRKCCCMRLAALFLSHTIQPYVTGRRAAKREGGKIHTSTSAIGVDGTARLLFQHATSLRAQRKRTRTIPVPAGGFAQRAPVRGSLCAFSPSTGSHGALSLAVCGCSPTTACTTSQRTACTTSWPSYNVPSASQQSLAPHSSPARLQLILCATSTTRAVAVLRPTYRGILLQAWGDFTS